MRPSIARDSRHARGQIWLDLAILIGMRTVAAVLGPLLALGGLVWIAQGLDLPFAPRSFMTADRTWIVLGFIAVVAGVATFSWARRTS
jgi:hypothetical protein